MGKKFYRSLIYGTGLLILAFGLALNTKTGLGVSPIISVSYSISDIFQLNFGNMTLLLYSTFVVIEIILHLIRSFRKKERNLKHILLLDVLQIPLSIIFTRFLNLFASLIPDLYTEGAGLGERLVIRVLFLILAICCTGIGAAMSLNMRIVPNPGDGIVQAISDTAGKNLGLVKNCFDLTNIAIAVLLSLTLAGHLSGVGVGTILAMIGVGRVIALFNHFTYKKLNELCRS